MVKTDIKFRIWKVDFTKKYVKTGEPVITEVFYFKVLGFTKNYSLVIVDNFNTKRWIKEEFYNSINAPIWFETTNKKYGYIFRAQTDTDLTAILAATKICLPDNN